MPVLAVAVGIYLPLELSSAIFIGGLISYFASKYFKNKISEAPESEKESFRKIEKISSGNGLLFASGLITGEALVGIMMAIPIVIFQDRDVFSVVSDPMAIPGILVLSGVCYWLYKVASSPDES